MKEKNLIKRIIMAVMGVMICAVCVALFKMAAFGVDPFQSFMSGIVQFIPINFGVLYTIVNAVLLIFTLVFDRHYLGIATIINLALLGQAIEYSLKFFQYLFPEPNMVLRIVFISVGLIVLCLGCSLYITADLGVSTYDAVALVMANKWKIGKFKYIRICTDLCCVCAGIGLFLLGHGAVRDIPTMAGVGTVITAFCMGPMIDFFNEKVSKPFLYGRNAKEE